MLNRVLELSLANRFLIVVFAGLIMASGVYSMRQLPVDAVPDVTPNQVQILTNARGLSPVEVEQFITFPVETAMSGLPGITLIRSVSRFGLSAVTIYFDEGMDIYFCRRLVMERLPRAREAIGPRFGNPELGPISTGLGEIYQFEVKGDGYSLMELRTILDWDIAFKLRSVHGVVEVNTYGGELKTYEVQLDAAKLVSYKIPIEQVFRALEQNNGNSGGGYIEHAQEQYLIRGEGLVRTLEDIDSIIVATGDDGTPIYIRNLGKARFAPMVRQGAVTRDGRGEAVTGIVMMLIGENGRVVVDRVKTKLQQIEKTMPPGVTIEPYYDRTDLVRKTINTVGTNLTEGALLVVTVLFLLLGNLRAGLIVAAAIPLSMLVAFTGMLAAGISGNLMSLGAIDFGLIVDASVVMIENTIRHLTERRHAAGGDRRMTEDQMRTVVVEAGREVLRPIVFAVGIIIIVYLPILTLQGIEGKMFRPMAMTVIFALVGSLVLTLTVTPVLASLFLRQGVKEEETWIIRQAKRGYRRLLSKTMQHPAIAGSAAAALFASSLGVATFLGAEFIPTLDEGTIALQAWRLPSVSLEESVRTTTRIEQVLKQFPEVVTVVSRTGRAEIATDPMGVEVSDIYLILKPDSEWTTARTKDDLIEAVNRALTKAVPGNMFSYSQPIELRVQELIAGVRSDIAITIFGEDMETLRRLGDQVVRVVSEVPGAADTKAEQVAGMPYHVVAIDREKIARYGINAEQVLDTVTTLGGRIVGQVAQGNRRFFMQVRFSPEDRKNFERILDIRISDSQGRLIPLRQLADIRMETGLAQISRENIQRRLAVETNVRGRDLAGFVGAAQKAVESHVTLPPGYWIKWGGEFENLQRGSARLAIVVPIALFLIFVLLYTTFNSVRPALLIYLNVPLAATGGILALALRGMPFSISAGVGFIALFGVAVLNGVVLMSYILDLRKQGRSAEDAAYEGALIRMRPVLMTALVASLGFMPMALSTSAGAEVQRPLATVVIGGLVTSTALTLLVLPTLYVWEERLREAWTQRRWKAKEVPVPHRPNL
ncbi:MAG: CusA/CzcA family heavy metal efflux RND transporter [Nitrospiraceae bacterium]|jgi:cobalt-zinc-cadmium resistance protein CzcA|uniref:efflux RND transporter permease subunit n=1 Tax=Nitrospira cf. moscoviensis SBR1015 TaxID=96242 RepID=UPI000A0B696C|nr:CusA/CzcA family heavy metal efflux RND transporter [Nitrospira cf. moscoviensis SBR1015]MBY0248517.1 CusA/CzcA family heavy metal efflux RND transporter [Nitrospiraceae bacterium]OQW32405.1 MAG: cation transporter [Nitrospira sp. SG-bin2]